MAKKLQEIQATYTGNPAYYFAGVAINIFRESLRKETPPAVVMPKPTPPDEDEERDFACLESCVQKLNAVDRDLVLTYYEEERQAKIDRRKKLADKLGVGLNALRIRACRIRARLLKCVELCRNEAEPT